MTHAPRYLLEHVDKDFDAAKCVLLTLKEEYGPLDINVLPAEKSRYSSVFLIYKSLP